MYYRTKPNVSFILNPLNKATLMNFSDQIFQMPEEDTENNQRIVFSSHFKWINAY
jgi:hypothetical protein